MNGSIILLTVEKKNDLKFRILNVQFLDHQHSFNGLKTIHQNNTII